MINLFFLLQIHIRKENLQKRPKMVTYVDGPFRPDKTLPVKNQKEQLRDLVYNTMVKRAENNNITVIKYEKRNTE